MGGTWHIKLDVGGGRDCHGLRGEDLGGGQQCAELLLAQPGRPTPSASEAAVFGPSMCTLGISKPGRKLQPKVNGGLMTGVC